MSKYLIPFLLLVTYTEINCWNYRLNFLTSKALFWDTKYAIVHNLDVIKTNRTYSYLRLNLTVIKEVKILKLAGQIYSYVSNRYKEFLPKIGANVCGLLANTDLENENEFSKMIINKVRQPLVNMWTGPGQHFFTGCPILKDNYFAKMHLNEDDLPSFFLPAGRYRLDVDFVLGKKDVLKIMLTFEIVEYLTEAHKRRG